MPVKIIPFIKSISQNTISKKEKIVLGKDLPRFQTVYGKTKEIPRFEIEHFSNIPTESKPKKSFSVVFVLSSNKLSLKTNFNSNASERSASVTSTWGLGVWKPITACYTSVVN